MIRTTLWVLIALCATLAAPLAAGAASNQQTACTLDAMIVFDASGSMAASDFPEGLPKRIDRVRSALAKFLPRVSKTRNLGLIVYGPGKHRNVCRNIDLRFSPIPDAADRIVSDVADLIPAGRTPLTDAVRRAAEVFDYGKAAGTIVLLTDGEETCGGDPCQLARDIRASNPGLSVHVIGYKLQSLDGKPPVSGAKCLADTTGGTYSTAETIDQLVSALSKALGCPTLADHHAPLSTLLR